MNKKKWLTLSVVGIGLLLIPRRSSRHSTSRLVANVNVSEKPDAKGVDVKREVNRK